MYETSPQQNPHIVVKVLDPANEEAAIIERFQADLRSPNHVIPGEVICSAPPLLVMPCLSGLYSVDLYDTSLTLLVDVFLQILEVRSDFKGAGSGGQ